MKKQLLSAVLAVSLTACAGATVEKADVNPTPHDMKAGEGLLSGRSGNLLDGFKLGGSKGVMATASPVNVYLWRASLDALSFMPLTSASTQDGVIITDWYQNPNNLNERVKVNVYVLGQTFNAQNLKVAMFKQQKQSGDWVSVNTDSATVNQLEETILTNARALKIKVEAAH